MSASRVLIVDDQEVFRRSIRTLLVSRQDWQVCGEAVDGLDAVEKAKRLKPNIILMDISMPRMNGLEAARIIRKELPECEVIIVSQNEREIIRRQADEVNACGFVIKTDVSHSLIPALEKLGNYRSAEGGAAASDGAGHLSAPGWLAGERERFDLVAQVSEIGFWFCDLPFEKLSWDNRVKEHFWLPPESDVTIDLFYRQLHPDDRERTRQAIADSIANHTHYNIEYRTVSPQGQEKWIRVIGQTFYDAAGQPRRFDGISLDITERKRADAALQQITREAIAATAKFRAVFEQTSVFAGIMTTDGLLTAANRLSLDACGYREEDVVGKQFWQTGWWRLAPDSQEKIREATARVAQGTPYREVLTYYFADGTERLVDLALHPVRDQDGQILFLQLTGVDITDLKSAEDKYRTLAETLEVQVRTRTEELEQRNREVLMQSEQLRQLSHSLMQLQDNERRYIARELHDSAGQILTALGMKLASIARETEQLSPHLTKQVEEGQQMVQELTQEIRTTSYLLHPPLLDETGLHEALQVYAGGLKDRSDLDIALDVAEDFERLPREMELVIFRIVQECLTNIHRHSGSKVATIRMARKPHSVLLEIEDKGKGISPQRLIEIQLHGAGVGMRGIRERVLQFGGQMKIQSDGGGTQIAIALPLAKSEHSRIAGYVRQPQAVVADSQD